MVRRFWVWGGSLFTIGFLGFFGLQTVNALASKTTVEDRSFPAAGIATVDVETFDGRIEVVGADVEEITVHSVIDNGVVPTRHTVQVVDGTLRIRSSCSWLSTNCQVEEVVTVPRSTVVLAASGDGHVTVRGVDGSVRVRTGDGGIDLAGLGGDFDAGTGDGHVTGTDLRSPHGIADTADGGIDLAFVEPPTLVVAGTGDGAVTVVVPDDETTYAVDLSSGDGDEEIGIRTDPASEHRITLESGDGSLTVTYPTPR
jgi:hypothetical protein